MSYTNISLGQKVEALSIKLSDLQREVAGLRQDVRQLLHLLREGKQAEEAGNLSEEQPRQDEDGARLID